MTYIEVFLLKPVESLGNEGEKVRVKRGYARNYLLPSGKAMPLSQANRKYIDSLMARKEERLSKEKKHIKRLVAKVENLNIRIGLKTGKDGKVFGSVNAARLLEELSKEGIVVKAKQLNLHTHASSIGKHTTSIKFGEDIKCKLKWEIFSSEEL